MTSFIKSALAVLLVAVSLLLPARAEAGPGTLAVLYFENQGNPQLEPLKVGLAQMLITDLQGTPGVKVVERAELQAILDELELGHSGAVDPDTAAKVGKLLGAEYLLLGSYFEMMGTLRMDARLVKVETGEILFAQGVNDQANNFMSMEKQLAGAFQTDLQARVALPEPPAEPATPEGTRAAAGATPTQVATVSTSGAAPAIAEPDPEALDAALAFSEGLIFLDRKDTGRARESFQAAVAADPSLEAAQAELAALDI